MQGKKILHAMGAWLLNIILGMMMMIYINKYKNLGLLEQMATYICDGLACVVGARSKTLITGSKTLTPRVNFRRFETLLASSRAKTLRS